MICIVGGGLAGISAALEAKLNGAKEVTLLEGRNRLGGATWSFEKDGISFDNGQHVFLRCCDAYQEFLRRIGSDKSVYLQPRLKVPVVDLKSGLPKYSKIQRRGKQLLGSLLMYKHLKPRERMNAIAIALKLRKLDPGDSSLDEVAFGDWLAKYGASPNSINRLWNLIVLPTINVDASQASLKLATKVFVTGLLQDARGGDIGWGEKPFSALHDQASRQTLEKMGVKVLLNTKVQKIEPKTQSRDEKHHIYIGDQTILADTLILAVPHNQLDDILLKGALVEEAAQTEGLGVSPIVNVHFVFDRKVMPHLFLAGLGTEVQYVFDRTKAAGLNPSEAQCLAISLSGADRYLSQNAKSLETHFLAELNKIFPEVNRAKLLHSIVTRENSATFRGVPGSHKYRAKTKTKIQDLYMAGAWTDTEWPATMEGAVRSGIYAAQSALQEQARQ